MTRTDIVSGKPEEILMCIDGMEAAGWGVRQIIPLTPDDYRGFTGSAQEKRFTDKFLIVFERDDS